MEKKPILYDSESGDNPGSKYILKSVILLYIYLYTNA